MVSEHKKIEYALHEKLVAIKGALDALGFERRLFDRVEECINLIKTNQYNVAVMGEFKRGKSTLINALLKQRVLPADATPTTATVNRITYGAEKKVVVRFKDGSDEKEIGIGELGDYVTQSGGARAANVKEAVVYYPTPICKDHIDIIDTPGLNDNNDMTKITIDLIEKVDAVILPISASSPYSIVERDFVCQLISSKGIANIIFVATHIDNIDEDEYDEHIEYIGERVQKETLQELAKRGCDENIMAKAHSLLDNLSVGGISAKDALDSYAANDPQKLEKSRFEEFRNVLNQSLSTSAKLENAINKTVDNIKGIINEFESQNKKRLDYFQEEINAAQSCKPAIAEYGSGVKRFLDDIFAEDYDKINEVITGLYGYKTIIKKAFIKELSKITEDTDTHACILAALEKARDNATEEIMLLQKSETEKRIYDIFNASAEKMISYRKNTLGQVFDDLKISDSANGLSAASLVAFVETALQSIGTFSWSEPPIPTGVADLTKVNPIETVEFAADRCVECRKKELEDAVAAIRKNWFRQFDEDTKFATGVVFEAVKKQEVMLGEERAAYNSNYRKYRESSKAILAECESVRAK